MEKTIKNKSGITLIALVITIIVIIILAGISISILSGENGVLNQAQKSKESTELAQIKEELIEKWYEFEREKAGEFYTDSATIATEFQNKLRDTTDDKTATVTYDGTTTVEGRKVAYKVTFRTHKLYIFQDGTVEQNKTDE